MPRPLPQARAKGSLPGTQMSHRLGRSDWGTGSKEAVQISTSLSAFCPRPLFPPLGSRRLKTWLGSPQSFSCLLEDPPKGPRLEGIQSPKQSVQRNMCRTAGLRFSVSRGWERETAGRQKGASILQGMSGLAGSGHWEDQARLRPPGLQFLALEAQAGDGARATL